MKLSYYVPPNRVEEQTEIIDQLDQVTVQSNSEPAEFKQESITVPDVNEIPEYMIVDPLYVGYETIDQQENLYRISSRGIFNLLTNSVLDVGCGRGDFGHYIKTVINSNIKYTGIDMNPIQISVGQKKYSQFSPESFELLTESFTSEFKSDKKWDWVFLNNVLTIDYGFNYSFKQWVETAIQYCTQGVVVCILNPEYNSDSSYITYNLNIINSELYNLNCQYSIENFNFQPEYLKITIYKN